jgi:hypothetical protein
MPLAVVGRRPPCRPSTPAAATQQGHALSPRSAPTVEEIVTVMRVAGDKVHGPRLRGLIVVLWRPGAGIPLLCQHGVGRYRFDFAPSISAASTVA